MATLSENFARADSLTDVLVAYAVIVYPLIASGALIVLGYAFDVVGWQALAGVTAATGIIIAAITVVIYLLFWILGRFGH